MMHIGRSDQSEIIKHSAVEKAVDYQLSSWWPIVERVSCFKTRYNHGKQGNEYVVTDEAEFLVSKAFNFTEDMLIRFIDRAIVDDKSDEIERERFERNIGLEILLDYWGGRGRSRMRQRDIAKKYEVTEPYVSQVINKAKMQLELVLDRALCKNLITKRQKEIFLACYKDNLKHREIADKLSISQSYVSREIRVVKKKIGKTFVEEVLNRSNSEEWIIIWVIW